MDTCLYIVESGLFLLGKTLYRQQYFNPQVMIQAVSNYQLSVPLTLIRPGDQEGFCEGQPAFVTQIALMSHYIQLMQNKHC